MGSPASGVAVPEGHREARLLVVEDEPTILELLSGSLRFAGFDVLTAASGAEALRVAAAARPDLILLDVMLPDGDGFDVVRTHPVRRAARAGHLPDRPRPIVHERVAGLTLGGDDYVTKPFSLDEVLARIRAVLRRGRGGPQADSSRLVVADLELDEDSHEVRRRGSLVTLTPTEFKLLRYLMINAGQVLSKAQILDHVWDYSFSGDGNVVEPCISYLRRKADQGEPRLIHTIRGVGYVLRSAAAVRFAAWHRRLRAALAKASLRVRVMAVAAFLVTITSVVMGSLGTTLLHGYLLGRADQQLRDFAVVASRSLAAGTPVGCPGPASRASPGCPSSS